MKHTKKILKSLLITVMALLLLLSSCTKDKNPTNPNNLPVTGGDSGNTGGGDSGDTIFANGIGRTDLPTGNYSELENSIM